MRNRKYAYAGMLCMVLMLSLFVSSAYMVHEAGHDCIGENCPVCHLLAVNADVLRLFGMAVLVLAMLAVLQGRTICPERTCWLSRSGCRNWDTFALVRN